MITSKKKRFSLVHVRWNTKAIFERHDIMKIFCSDSHLYLGKFKESWSHDCKSLKNVVSDFIAENSRISDCLCVIVNYLFCVGESKCGTDKVSLLIEGERRVVEVLFIKIGSLHEFWNSLL